MSPLQLPDRRCGDAHIPEALDWRWKQHMSLSWWCFVVVGIVQLRYWHAIVGDRIPKTRTGRVRKPQWGEFPFHFSGLWKIFKQGRIHMENHLPMTCWLLHSDPRHQEVNNILYKHWIVTKKIHITASHAQRIQTGYNLGLSEENVYHRNVWLLRICNRNLNSEVYRGVVTISKIKYGRC